MLDKKPIAIACSSGGFKAIFVHGVLSAFESMNFCADAYSAASASVVIAAFASLKQARQAGVDYWLKGIEMYDRTKSMSQVSLAGINYLKTYGGDKLFKSSKPQFYVATSQVITQEAAEQTQSKLARRLGKKLLIAAAKGDRNWVDEHLRLDIFSTVANGILSLNCDNFSEVAYASTRMLHNYDKPAWIDNEPHIDASYTCVCPAVEMVDRGYQTVIAIATEPGELYRDLFQLEIISSQYQQASIHPIQPDINLKQLGVNVFQATPEGIAAVYQHGWDKGKEFLAELND